MKQVIAIVLLIAAVLLIAKFAFADWTEQRIGNMDYVSGDNGYSGTGQQIGNTYYYNDNRGGSSSCQRIGNQTYCS